MADGKDFELAMIAVQVASVVFKQFGQHEAAP